MPSATVLFSVRPWVRKSGTSEPSAPGIRLRCCQNAESWFYLAGAYAPLVQWQILRGERVSAARNGNRIRVALERTLQIDSTLADAHFGIGLYYYYADVAPAGAKLVRWLLMLPGGDRTKGLNEMSRARDGGALLRGEADYQLHLIYIWYEHRPQDAIALLRSLDQRYAENPLFLQRLAETYDTYLHDERASADAWQTLADRASRGGVYDASRVARLADLCATLYSSVRANIECSSHLQPLPTLSELPEVATEDADRPPVRGAVMSNEQDDVLFRSELEQRRPKHDVAAEIKRSLRLLAQPSGQLRLPLG